MFGGHNLPPSHPHSRFLHRHHFMAISIAFLAHVISQSQHLDSDPTPLNHILAQNICLVSSINCVRFSIILDPRLPLQALVAVFMIAIANR